MDEATKDFIYLLLLLKHGSVLIENGFIMFLSYDDFCSSLRCNRLSLSFYTIIRTDKE